MHDDHGLGPWLKERRTRLDPSAFGLSGGRRRTPGLRREEVASRANISTTWYTWLEQGRGGAPSPDVLERIARALLLTDVEREHLFLIGLGRPPEVRPLAGGGVSERLQRVLEALEPSPALIKTLTWDVLAWNRAATLVFTDYAARPPERRNLLRMMFLETGTRPIQQDWGSVARFVVETFRIDAARAGQDPAMQSLVQDLMRGSPEFVQLWDAHEVRHFGEGLKHLTHPVLGELTLNYSGFVVDGRPDLSMLVYDPATAEQRERIRVHLRQAQGGMPTG